MYFLSAMQHMSEFMSSQLKSTRNGSVNSGYLMEGAGPHIMPTRRLRSCENQRESLGQTDKSCILGRDKLYPCSSLTKKSIRITCCWLNTAVSSWWMEGARKPQTACVLCCQIKRNSQKQTVSSATACYKVVIMKGFSKPLRHQATVSVISRSRHNRQRAMKMSWHEIADQMLCNNLCTNTVHLAEPPCDRTFLTLPGQDSDRGESQKQLRSVHTGFDLAEFESGHQHTSRRPHPQSSPPLFLLQTVVFQQTETFTCISYTSVAFFST